MGLVFKNINNVNNEIQMLVRDWRNDDNIRKYMYIEEKISVENHMNWLKSLENSSTKIVYIVLYDEQPIGVISVDNIDIVNKKCEWAFYIYDTSLRGKGIGKRLETSMVMHIFDTLKMEKLNCSVLDTNSDVIAMHEKFGFTIEGIKRENILKDGKRISVYDLGMTLSEWQDIKRNLEIKKSDLATFE